MRLIDADELYEKKHAALKEGEVLYRFTPRDIDNAETVDAVPVVRCRECVLCRELVKGLYRCEHWGANIEGESPDGFCSAGVTKEESERKMKA